MIEKTEYLTTKNRTCTYLLPLLGNTSHEFKNLEQCFVGDKAHPGEHGKLYLLFRIEHEPWFNEYLNSIKDHKTDEEQRLAYVAFTRAKYSLKFMKHGEFASRYITRQNDKGMIDKIYLRW